MEGDREENLYPASMAWMTCFQILGWNRFRIHCENLAFETG